MCSYFPSRAVVNVQIPGRLQQFLFDLLDKELFLGPVHMQYGYLLDDINNTKQLFIA